MAMHPSILAWDIPGTEEPSRLQSMGSRRVGEDLVGAHMSIFNLGSFCAIESYEFFIYFGY